MLTSNSQQHKPKGPLSRLTPSADRRAEGSYRDWLGRRLDVGRGLEEVRDRFRDVALFQVLLHLLLARPKDPAEDLDQLQQRQFRMKTRTRCQSYLPCRVILSQKYQGCKNGKLRATNVVQRWSTRLVTERFKSQQVAGFFLINHINSIIFHQVLAEVQHYWVPTKIFIQREVNGQPFKLKLWRAVLRWLLLRSTHPTLF